MITFNRKHPKIVLVDNVIVSSMLLNKGRKKTMSFGSVYRSHYYLSRVWGLASFSIATDSNEEIKIAKIRLYDVVWFLATISIYSLFTFDELNQFEDFRRKSNQKGFNGAWILIACARLVNILGFSYGILVVVMNICNRFNLMNLVNMYIRFDKEVYSCGKLALSMSQYSILMLIPQLPSSKDGKIQSSFRL